MFPIRLSLMLGVVSLLLAAGSPTGARPPEEPAAALAEAAADPYTEVEWSNGEPAPSLIPTSQGFCYLAGVQGNFSTSADQTGIYISQGQALLVGFNNVEWAKAICVDWSALTLMPNSPTVAPVRWLSDEFQTSTECFAEYRDAWWGDAVTFLTWVGGNFAATGWASITQSSHGNTTSRVSATSSCGDNTRVYARGRSMFFGQPHAQDMPQFRGPNGQGPYDFAGNYSVASTAQDTLNMAPVDTAFCYLQGVWGTYNHPGDAAWISRETNQAGKMVWKLRVQEGNPVDGKSLSAVAACYMLTQY